MAVILCIIHRIFCVDYSAYSPQVLPHHLFFYHYYHRARPHLSLNKDAPFSRGDPTPSAEHGTTAGVALVLVASRLPARRAAGVDPMVATSSGSH